MLESNLPGINLMADKKVKRGGAQIWAPFTFFRSQYAFINSSE